MHESIQREFSLTECEQIGRNIEDKIFNVMVSKLNDNHKSENVLSYFDQLSIDLFQSDEILKDLYPVDYKELMATMKVEYRKLNLFSQHCLSLYLSTDKDEDQILESMIWNFEELMEKRANDFLSSSSRDKQLRN